MDINLKYIQNNFVEWKDLCDMAKISSQRLKELIAKELVPEPSYCIKITRTISSPLGDSMIISEKEKYFSRNSIDLVKENLLIENSSDFKNIIKEEFIETFIHDSNNRYAYGTILDKDGNVNMTKLDIAFEDEWISYLKGIYGICTINSTGTEIVKKEIAVKKLIEFNQRHKGALTESEKMELLKLNSEYNEISALFAPYQRKESSRGKYLDEILNFNLLTDYVRTYR